MMNPASQRFFERIRRNDEPSYVYTYPFKGAYRPLTESMPEVTAWADFSGPLNLYVHVPFCNMKCSFCNLFTTQTHQEAEHRPYAMAVLDEARFMAKRVDFTRAETGSIYFGGGTPTLLRVGDLEMILDGLRELFRFRADAELCIESTPDAANVTYLKGLLRIGFRRISFGVQTFSTQLLRTMGRHYHVSLGRQLVSDALDVGFKNVNLDLIYGLPGQTSGDWIADVQTAAQLNVPTITLYPLTLRTRTTYGRLFTLKPHAFTRGAQLYDLLDAAQDVLLSAGYEQRTMVCFAKSGGGCTHEANEFFGVSTLGLGAGALTYGPRLHYTTGRYVEHVTTTQIIADYLGSLNNGELPPVSGITLNGEETRRRFVILSLSYAGLSESAYRARFGESVRDIFGDELNALYMQDCLETSPERLRLSRRGRRFTSLVADLFASDRVLELAEAYR